VGLVETSSVGPGI